MRHAGKLPSCLNATPKVDCPIQSGRAVGLVWATSRPLFNGLFSNLIVATLIAGVMPALAAWIGHRIVDAVVQAMQIHGDGSP